MTYTNISSSSLNLEILDFLLQIEGGREGLGLSPTVAYKSGLADFSVEPTTSKKYLGA